MRILICGGHNFDDRDKLAATLNRLHDERRFVLVITSGARGADTLAEEWANARGLACHRVVPWTPRTRNQRMLDEGRPELVVAFPGGFGTADMVRRARSAGIEVIEIEPARKTERQSRPRERPATERSHGSGICPLQLRDAGLDPRMNIRGIGILTTGTVAIAKIDVVRMHAADIYAAPAVGEFFDCKCWRNETESIFFGLWADVERAKNMLATIRSAMDREFAAFFETNTGGENPKSLAASFSKGMGHRISERLRRLKAGRTANVVARGKDLAAKLFPRAPQRKARSSISAITYAAGIAAGDRVELLVRGSRAAMADLVRFRHSVEQEKLPKQRS